MILISSNFLFGFSSSPLVTSIRCALLSLAFLVAMHTYIILPVLLTLAPPSTRPRRVRVAQMFPSTSCSQMKRARPKRQLSRTSNSRSIQSRKSDPICKLVTNVPRVVVKDETSLWHHQWRHQSVINLKNFLSCFHFNKINFFSCLLKCWIISIKWIIQNFNKDFKIYFKFEQTHMSGS